MPRHSESTLAAIKQAVDIVDLVGEYLQLHRSGSKYKALCPFHDDHNPSLELNPERQSFKCWSCGAGGDVFDFVQEYERVEFPEALRMLADRAGITLDNPTDRTVAASGPSKSELLAVCAWAERQFVKALPGSPEASSYVAHRGITPESVARFQLGFAPDQRDWLSLRARRQGYSTDLLEQAGLIARSPESHLTRDRFRGRLIFPIHDIRGRTIGFGGRILPDLERKWAESGRNVAKYVNSPETLLFQKRRHLYAADLARPAAREAGWVAVVEGYTDVIAAHQVGLQNVVGTLGTALGDEHVLALRRLADRVVLVFDADEAGQKAADRSLELFLGHEVDVRVLSLPEGLDPCDFLLREGAGPFRELVARAVDPLEFVLRRASGRFNFDSLEGARQAAEFVVSILARIPRTNRAGLDVKVAKALDTLAHRLRLPVADLKRQLQHARRPARTSPHRAVSSAQSGSEGVIKPADPPIRVADLDVLDREIVVILLNQPALLPRLITNVAPGSLRDAPLRAIVQACYDLYAEGQEATFERVSLRLSEAERSLAAGLLLPFDSAPHPERLQPATWEERLAEALEAFADREWRNRLRDIKGAMDEIDPVANPDEYQALRLEYFRLYQQRPDTRKKTAS